MPDDSVCIEGAGRGIALPDTVELSLAWYHYGLFGESQTYHSQDLTLTYRFVRQGNGLVVGKHFTMKTNEENKIENRWQDIRLESDTLFAWIHKNWEVLLDVDIEPFVYKTRQNGHDLYLPLPMEDAPYYNIIFPFGERGRGARFRLQDLKETDRYENYTNINFKANTYTLLYELLILLQLRQTALENEFKPVSG